MDEQEYWIFGINVTFGGGFHRDRFFVFALVIVVCDPVQDLRSNKQVFNLFGNLAGSKLAAFFSCCINKLLLNIKDFY